MSQTTQLRNNNAPIGVFDSGIGGLSVLSTLIRYFPYESFIYYADNGNMPYGNKTKEQIQKYSANIIRWFMHVHKVKMVVAACNTSSALALEDISKEFTIPIIGTIIPIAQTVLSMNCSNIGIIATKATVSSGFHEITLRKHGFNGKITAVPCPEFVPLIETHPFNRMVLAEYAQHYLKPFQNGPFDTLIYGCTHYPLIKDIIEPLLPGNIKTLCPSFAITQHVQQNLNITAVNQGSESKAPALFYCNRDKEDFERKIRSLTSIHPIVVNCVSIEKDITRPILFENTI